MKSEITNAQITFDELTSRLRTYIRQLINRGEFTERSIARVLHISQPHVHNVLKGVRRMNVDLADQIMGKLTITIFDLISDQEIWNSLDEKNPDWLTQAAKRKPPVKSPQRESDPRAPWRQPRSGS